MTAERRLLEKHPQWPAALHVCATLRAAGFRALLAGGCVRDALMGRVAQDLDVATDAVPEKIAALFPKTVDVGKSFGVMRVLHEGADLEVATFRADGEYRDGRHPESVRYSDDREDALRRDFTVNALFFDPSTDGIIDHVGGRADLRAKLLRTVGEPHRRFAEDHLRLLRGVRFAVQLDFEIEAATWSEIRRLAPSVASVSRERLRDETGKLLKAGGGARAAKLFEESGLRAAALPELDGCAADLLRSAGIFLRRPVASMIEAYARWMVPADPAVFPNLRFSKTEERFLELADLTYPQRASFWSQPMGLRILAYDQPAARLVCTMWDEELGEDPRHAELAAAWKSRLVDGRLPPRMLRGEDLPPEIKGARLGEILHSSYEAQLGGEFTDRAGALTWLAGWLKLHP